jgi:hypothetical protein
VLQGLSVNGVGKGFFPKSKLVVFVEQVDRVDGHVSSPIFVLSVRLVTTEEIVAKAFVVVFIFDSDVGKFLNIDIDKEFYFEELIGKYFFTFKGLSDGSEPVCNVEFFE